MQHVKKMKRWDLICTMKIKDFLKYLHKFQKVDIKIGLTSVSLQTGEVEDIDKKLYNKKVIEGRTYSAWTLS